MKRISVLLLAAFLILAGAAPVQARAEKYLTLQEVCSYYGMSVPSTSYSYFVLFKLGGGYYCLSLSNANMNFSISTNN